mmetsp:Transcript_9459/g.38687  ORF Transcript_9459/g.38687 Transcript_9459/m.38687 type:complete len:331 (-) Transcript_9459:1106-2098(-)
MLEHHRQVLQLGGELGPYREVLLLLEGGEQRQHLVRGHPVGLGERELVVHEAHAVDGRQLADSRAQPVQEAGAAVGDAEEACLAVVQLQPPACRRRVERHRHLRPGSVEAHLVHCAVRGGHVDGERPEEAVVCIAGERRREEAALLQLQHDAVGPLLQHLGKDHGVAHLLRPLLHVVEHRLARGLCQRFPEVRRDRITVGMLREVAVHAPLEALLADEVHHLPNDGSALAIRNRIEYLHDLVTGGNIHFDGMGVDQAVQGQSSAVVVAAELGPDVPLRKLVVHGKVAHIGGESLVQPQLLPPLHCNQVAEPLVSQLVGHDVGDTLLRSNA